MKSILSFPRYDCNVPLLSQFGQVYVLDKSAISSDLPERLINWATPSTAMIICATRPLPRRDNPLDEAREALRYIVAALDDVIKAKETVIGFGILDRSTGCVLYITPRSVRESKKYGPIIPVVYRVHKPPLIFYLPILARVTSNAFQAILGILASNIASGEFSYTYDPAEGACISWLLPQNTRTEPKTFIPPDVLAAFMEYESCFTSTCVVCKKKANTSCDCGFVMYCNEMCQIEHLLTGDHMERC